MILSKNRYSFLFLISLFCTVTFFPSCVLDDTTANPVIPHNYTSFDALFKDSVFQATFKTVDAASAIDFNSDQGTNVHIEENTMVLPNGNVATGMIDIELIDLATKSDLLMAGVPLIKSDGTLLELIGGFYMEAMKDQESLHLNGSVALRFSAPGSLADPDGEAVVYHSSNQNSPLVLASDQSSIDKIGDNYNLNFDKLGWIMAAQNYIPNNGTTSLALTTNLNGTSIIDQQAFILFSDFRGMVSMPKNGTAFSMPGLPLGQSATIVMMAFDVTNFYIDTKEITLMENETLDMTLQGYAVDDFIGLLKGID